jgi:integrase
MSVTFAEQSQWFLEHALSRKRNPVKPSTVAGWKGALNKWLLPHFKDAPLASVSNPALRSLVEKMYRSGLAAQSIVTYTTLVKLIVASALNDEGEPVYPRKWNSNFIDLPTITTQRQPCFTSEQMSAILQNSEGSSKVLYGLLAGSGLRIGEAFALETKHILSEGRTLRIEQSCWGTTIWTPKTQNANRYVDLHSELAELVREHVGIRKEGFVFQNSLGGPLSQTNVVRRSFHPLLKRLGIEKQGFHGFRRFRCTWLRRNQVSEDLVKYWLGHAPQDVTDRYSKLSEDENFRHTVSEKVALGFQLTR